MNRLERGDFYRTTSHEDRLEMIELFTSHDIGVGGCTKRDRHKLSTYSDWPILKWNGRILSTYGRSRNQLSREEFLIKAGITRTSQGDSKIKHYFL